MTCNSVFALNVLNEHFTNTEHKKLYAKCQEEFKKYSEQSKSKTAETPIDEVKNKKDAVKDKENDGKNKKDDKDDVKDKNDDIKNKKDDIKDKTDDVKDKKKYEKTSATPVDINQNNVTTKIEIKSQSCGCTEIIRKKVPTNTEPDEATVYADGNNLTYNTGNTNAFCRICETKFPATLRSMKEHVNGKDHKKRLGRMNSNTQVAKTMAHITKKPMSKFIEHCRFFGSMFHQDIVINKRYCIPQFSYVLITRLGARFR